MRSRRVVSLFAALALFGGLMAATTSSAFAWSAPSVAPVCSIDQAAAVHVWTVTLSNEADFHVDWADNAAFAGATDVLMHAGANQLATPASVATLYVRWAGDHTSIGSASWNSQGCQEPTPTPTPTIDPTATPTPTLAPTPSPTSSQNVELTLIKVLCPSYSVVPANRNPTNLDATGGHGGQLDKSYQTTLVNPSTDIPPSCTRADGWRFQMYGGNVNGVLGPTVGAPLKTGADGAGSGSVTIKLNSAELALGQTSGSPTGLWVAEIQKPSVAAFGALRCYTDIQNGDDVETIANLGTSDQHIYCIAYNVEAASQPTPTATPTPFQSFEGETATPSSFQSVGGVTSRPTMTLPPTNTDSGSSNGSSTPIPALMICLAFGVLGLAAVQVQRRGDRR